jgi:hypothetical protein
VFGDEPVMEPYTHYYQRLVAHDQDEAAALAEEYRQTHALEAVYDDILIPALNAVKRDHALDTLTDEDVQFVLQATREIVEDFGLRQDQPAADFPVAAASSERAPARKVTARILGCPAHDEADELALEMLKQRLDPDLYALEIVSADMLTAEVLSMVEAQHVGLICIIALPPGALAPTRYLCKRLRSHFPDCRIVVGRWGLHEDWDKPHALLREAGADEVGLSLQETHNQLTEWSRVVSSTEA